MTFTYTHSLTSTGSSLIDEVYYNLDSRSLVLVMCSGNGYQYDNVPFAHYDDLSRANSLGGFYNSVIKPTHGPGKFLGYFSEEDDFFERGYKAPSMEAVTAGAGMPKGLVYRVEHDKDNATSAFGNVTLTLNPPVSYKRRHDVVFTVQGNDKVRTHTVQAESVDAAVDALLETASMLDLNFEVKAVTTYFV